jgi:hypothetical protein
VLGINCQDNAAGVIYGHFSMPESWDANQNAGTIMFELTAFNANKDQCSTTAETTCRVDGDCPATETCAAGAPNLAMDFDCQARTNFATVGNSWGTSQAVQVGFTQNDQVRMWTTVPTTCTGDTLPDAHIFFRATVETTNTVVDDIIIINLEAIFPALTVDEETLDDNI